MDKNELLYYLHLLLSDVPSCHNCPEAHLDDAVGWLCKEQDWKELSELYGGNYNPFEIADKCEYMEDYW